MRDVCVCVCESGNTTFLLQSFDVFLRCVHVYGIYSAEEQESWFTSLQNSAQEPDANVNLAAFT